MDQIETSKKQEIDINIGQWKELIMPIGFKIEKHTYIRLNPNTRHQTGSAGRSLKQSTPLPFRVNYH